MSMPDVTVEIAFDSGYLTAASSRTWTDVTDYVEADRGISIQRGRQDQFSSVQPSNLSLTLDNTDGRFTPEYAAGAYYPNVKKGRPIRVRANSVNLHSINDATFQTSVAGWAATGSSPPVVSHASTNHGIKSLLAAWTGGGGSPTVGITVSLTIGTTYTWSAELYVPSGGPDVRLNNGVAATSSTMSTKDAWVRVSMTWTAATSSHTLFVQPLTAGTAGQTYVDFVQLEVGSSATPFQPVTLFTGYVDEWPVEWPEATETRSTVTVSASSRMARLGRSSEFRSIVEEEVLYDGPVLYFPLGEPANSTTAGNISPGRTEVLTATQIGTGGTLEFGKGTGPGTDDLTAPTFTPVDVTNGLNLQCNLIQPVVDANTKYFQVEVWFTADASAADTFLVNLSGNAGREEVSFALCVSSAGVPFTRWSARAGLANVLTPPSVSDARNGETHHFVGVLNHDPATQTFGASMIYDGAAYAVSFSDAGTVFPNFTKLAVGGSVANDLHGGTISHVAIYQETAAAGTIATARFDEHRFAGTTGFTTDSSDERVARYARLAGIPSAEVSTATGLTSSVAHKDTTGSTPLDMLEAVGQTEDGVVFDAGDGTLTFHARDHRYNSTSAFTLDCDAGDIEEGLMPILDDQHLTNDVTASRPEGVKLRSTNAASITEYGSYRESLEVLTTSDNEVQSRADWLVKRFGTPRVAVPELSVELAGCSAAKTASLLVADIGTRFTVTNLPSQAPTSSADYFIEGLNYSIGVKSFLVSFNTSPTAYANVWQLDSSTYSVLDSTTVPAY